MTTVYEQRFYEDMHKLVVIQGEILKELKKMNEVHVEDVAIERKEKENKFYIGYDKSNDEEYSALTLYEKDNKGEIVLKRTLYGYDADLLMKIFESTNIMISKEKGE